MEFEGTVEMIQIHAYTYLLYFWWRVKM